MSSLGFRITTALSALFLKRAIPHLVELGELDQCPLRESPS